MKTILEYWKWLYNNNPQNYPKIVNFINTASNYINLTINNTGNLNNLLQLVNIINNPTSRAWGRDDIEVILNKKTGLIDLQKTVTLRDINWSDYDSVELYGKIIKLVKM